MAGLSLVLASCHDTPPVPRAVVLVSLDTLRADHLGTYGYDRPTSPNIDALADESIVFERAITQASSTLPAHRALFQSREASRAGGGATALAEVLERNGFRTAAFTGGGNVSAAFGFDRGFERYVDDPRGLGQAFDAVELWLRDHAEERFMLFIHTYDIHLPYDPPAPFDTRFDPDYTGEIDGAKTRAALRKQRRLREYADFDGSHDDPVALDAADRHKIVALYDGGILYTDQFVGRLLLLLRELGIRESTALVLFSDHGEEFWEHDSALHSHTLYQELLHVPLIVSLPGDWRAGARVDTPVRLMDIAPTVLDLFGIAVPASFRGKSLVRLMTGDARDHAGALSEIRDLRSWIAWPWKIVVRGSGAAAQTRLFDLDDDPGERRDVSRDHPDVVVRLREAMQRNASAGEAPFVAEVELDGVRPDLMHQLEALGYVDEPGGREAPH